MTKIRVEPQICQLLFQQMRQTSKKDDSLDEEFKASLQLNERYNLLPDYADEIITGLPKDYDIIEICNPIAIVVNNFLNLARTIKINFTPYIAWYSSINNLEVAMVLEYLLAISFKQCNKNNHNPRVFLEIIQSKQKADYEINVDFTGTISENELFKDIDYYIQTYHSTLSMNEKENYMEIQLIIPFNSI